jgi:hypothetical protein
MGEVNDKLRDLLTGHVNTAIRKASQEGAKRATAEALKSLNRTIGDKAFLAGVSKRIANEALSGVNKRLKTAEIVDTVGDLATAKAITAIERTLDKRLDELAGRVADDAVTKSMNAMKAKASTLGKSALPHVLSLVQDWLKSSAGNAALAEAAGGGGASAELLTEFDSRLRAVETGAAEEADKPDLDLTHRVVQLESAGLEDRLIALEDRPAPEQFDDTIIDEIDERIAALEARELDLPPEADRGLLAALEDRVAVLEERPSRGGSSVGFVLTPESDDLTEVVERVLALETSRTEFVEQVVEQVATHGEELSKTRSEFDEAREDLAAVAKKVRELSERFENLGAIPSGPPRPSPSEVPATIDLKDLSERVAILAIGPLMQAIDGRLSEAHPEELEGLPERVARLEGLAATFENDGLAERVAMQAVAKAMEALDGRLEELELGEAPHVAPEEEAPEEEAPEEEAQEEAPEEEAPEIQEAEDDSPAEERPAAPVARTAAEESDSGYLDEEFASFRRKRLEEQKGTGRLTRDEVNSGLEGWDGDEPAPDEDSDAGGPEAEAQDFAEPEEGFDEAFDEAFDEGPEEELEGRARTERLAEHASQWAREPLPDEAEELADDSDDSDGSDGEPPILPTRRDGP